MAHFAELDNNNFVIRTTVINNEVLLDKNGIEIEQKGSDLCAELFGGNWKQFSINTFNNTHVLGGTPFRANTAMPGMYFDQEKNAFYWKDFPSPHPSWVLSAGYVWEAPIPEPVNPYDISDYRHYNWGFEWNEETLSWNESLIDYK
jgi:hypothetical protein